MVLATKVEKAMNAQAVPVLDVFGMKQRLEVPLFQRQYVWNREEQWAPLWEDIMRKFCDYLEGRTNTPVHFLGAMVLDQKLSPTTHVVRRQVIDGQQRLTTLQIFLAALRDFCSEQGCEELALECKSYTLNSGMMADAKVDRFKVWPTALDRPQFEDVMAAGSRMELEKRHPIIRKKYARHDEPRPRMVEAYLFFYDQIAEFFLGDESGEPLLASVPLAQRIEECLTALKSALQVVIIDLGEKDDPQVIFETLNARGQPLLPADLLRNYIFLRAGREGDNQESLYEQYWVGFEDSFWSQEVRQGRLNRPRSDLFMQHFLTSRINADISPKHLYVEYKHWIEACNPFSGIPDELATLARQREMFRRIVDPQPGDVLFRLSEFLDVFEVSTVYPFLLSLLEAGLSDDEIARISSHLESYLVRRAVCGMTTKNYNRVFLALNKSMQSGMMSSDSVSQHIAALSGSSTLWPNDERFRQEWMSTPIYHILSSPRLALLFRRLNDALMSPRSEMLVIKNAMSIEHIMPQSWIEHWPLMDGAEGITDQDIAYHLEDEPDVLQTIRRNAVVQTIGNLTILTQPLNSASSNAGWAVKKVAIQKHSLLPINSSLQLDDTWDEGSIERRGAELFSLALSLWPYPNSPSAS